MDVARFRLRSKGYDVFNAVVTANINGSLFHIKMVEEWCGPLHWIEHCCCNKHDKSDDSSDSDDDHDGVPPLFSVDDDYCSNSEEDGDGGEREVEDEEEGDEEHEEVSIVQETLGVYAERRLEIDCADVEKQTTDNVEDGKPKKVIEVNNEDIMGRNVSLEKVDNLVHEGSKETHVSISKGCGGSGEGESGDVGKENICGNKGESSILRGLTLEVSRGEGNNDEEGAMTNMGVCKYQASLGKLKKKKKNSGAAAGDKKEKRKNKKDLGVLQSDNTLTVRDILAPASSSHGSKSISKEGVVRNPFTPYHPSSSCSEPSKAAASASQVESVGDSGIMMGNNRFEKAMERSKAEKLWRIAKDNLGVSADPADDEIYVEKIKEMEERDTTAKGRKGKTQVSK